jgi:nucleoside-diphosphate-sugar epimerase
LKGEENDESIFTGGSGYVGSVVAETLLEHNHEVLVGANDGAEINNEKASTAALIPFSGSALRAPAHL